MAPPIHPAVHDESNIARDTEVAHGDFRRRRIDERLAECERQFPASAAAAAFVIDALSALLTIPADCELLAGLVANTERYSALRSLAAPPISAADLHLLVRSRVTPTALRANQRLADDVSKLLSVRLDPTRFPWLAEARPPTGLELDAAKLATAVLMTARAARASRRGSQG